MGFTLHRHAHRAAVKYTHPDTYPNAKQLKRSTQIILYSTCAVFLFTTFILFIIATAGSTANYSPIHNIYIGDADISHINVTKVIPQIAPVLTILGTALTAPDSSVSQIFGSLKAVADTPALTPLLSLLVNANSTSDTVIALTKLAPLAIGNDSDSSTKELVAISGLLNYSQDKNQTLESLGELVLPTLEQQKSGQPSDNSTTMVLNILQNSQDTVSDVDALYSLNNLTLADKTQLLPVFQIFSLTNNVNGTLEALGSLMNASVPSALGVTLLTTLQGSLNGNANQDLSALFTTLQSSVPESQKDAVSAVETLLDDSTNKNSTINNLLSLLRQNVTTSPSAKVAFADLTTLLTDTKNQTLVLKTVPQLAAVRNSTLAGLQLAGLGGIVKSTNNPRNVLGILSLLSEGLADPNTNTDAVPSLFGLLTASTNPYNSFTSLVSLTAWATSNPETFTPIVKILQDANQVTEVTQEQLYDLTPSLLDYLEIPAAFRLSIFTLCEINMEGKVVKCNAPHAVQNLDFRNIIYNSLIDSQFKPYLNALNITANDLYLEGKLLHRQHQYVPAVKAALSMNLIAIIVSFFGIFGWVILLVPKYGRNLNVWCYTATLTSCAALFSCLGAGVIAIMVTIIKSGTSHDKFNVVYTIGSAYYGCVWCGFATACIATFIFLYCAFYARVGKPRDGFLMTEKNMNQESSDSVSSMNDGNYNAEKVVQSVDVANLEEDSSNSDMRNNSPRHAMV
ncbi:Uncharacterized protein RNJ44_01687 [Nakaseomyces bracarensis]|uniref:Uncharacterized protein n=1 Tax=Nakaseomyces bracarensis TaxID=273131 RepID=A0ABR4NNI7_9SACH